MGRQLSDQSSAERIGTLATYYRSHAVEAQSIGPPHLLLSIDTSARNVPELSNALESKPDFDFKR
jgi:hypothetical protein